MESNKADIIHFIEYKYKNNKNNLNNNNNGR